VPANVNKCILAEFEFEITYIERIYVNGFLKAQDLELVQGEKFIFDVCSGDHIAFNGLYAPESASLNIIKNPVGKNDAIFRFLDQFKQRIYS